MFRYLAMSAVVLAAFAGASPASAQSSFPQTCSNTVFAYSGSNPVMQSVCLTNGGAPHATSLTLVGIVVDGHGMLVNVHNNQPSTFQTMCGSIEISTDGPIVSLNAYCRASNLQFNETSISLDNINNNNGNLVYGKL